MSAGIAAGPPACRARGDDGAAIIEFALMVPFLGLMLLGLFEFGLAYQRRAAIDNALGSANRMAVQLGRDRSADAETLRAIAAATASMPNVEVVRAVVWKANTGTSGPRCTTGPSVADVCNVYTGAQVLAGDAGVFTGTDTCSADAWDAAWCPTGRTDSERNQDYVGVYVEIRYRALTKVTSDWITLTGWNVMRIEPPLGTDQ
jgi:Flp pilus assembly protein TadG